MTKSSIRQLLLAFIALAPLQHFEIAYGFSLNNVNSNSNSNSNSRISLFATPSSCLRNKHHRHTTSLPLAAHPGSATTDQVSAGFIDTELRGAAMRLHTRSQAPKEGQAEEKQPPKNAEPYVTTHMDYLHFLVDSQHVYRAFEDIVQLQQLQPELSPFIQTGLERTQPLETDILFICNEYNLPRPNVGTFGTRYAQQLWDISSKGKDGIPEFICHYYNHYFAHTAGGRMIGKQMAALLLKKKTLEFYKWDGDINLIKSTVKNSIELLAATWTPQQKQLCVDATADVFRGSGSINSYLAGSANSH